MSELTSGKTSPSTPIIICDDSNMARKQMARCLPADWDVDITFAENGAEAISALQQGRGDILFLDLTMPVMDGFETLQEIRNKDLPTMVIVVSGDVQDEARRRVMQLGAMDFIRKPASVEVIREILERFGIVDASEGELQGREVEPLDIGSSETAQFDAYRELTNVAMGRAGDLLAKITGEFITLPIPVVNLFEPQELQMALHFSTGDSVSAICQGFTGSGIAGEALVIFSDADLPKLAALIKHDQAAIDLSNKEILADVAGMLLGAVLTALGEQLHLEFSQTYPSVLGLNAQTETLIKTRAGRSQKTLAIEVSYEIESSGISCELLLLFAESSITALNKLII